MVPRALSRPERMAQARFENSHLSETNRSVDMQSTYGLKEKSEQIHYLCWKRETEAARTLAKCLLNAVPGVRITYTGVRDRRLRLWGWVI